MTELRIAALASNSWDGPWMNRQQLLSRMGERHNITYSTGPMFMWQRFSRDWWGAPALGAFRQEDHVRVDESPKWALRSANFPSIDSRIVHRYAKRLKRTLDAQVEPVDVCYIFHPDQVALAEAMNAKLLVYHPYDQFASYPDWTPSQAQCEARLCAVADRIIASSSLIAENLPLQNNASTRISIIPNGADYKSFAAPVERVPDELVDIPSPRIAYFGNLTKKVDLELLRDLAIARPDWSIVLVGGYPHDDADMAKMKNELQARPNVFLLGAKPHTDVPMFVHSMDVNLLCYRVGEGLWSEACSPLKLYEYLAAGRPVVSADILAVAEHKDVIATASSAADWETKIAAALNGYGVGSVETRRAVARQNTWGARVEEIESLLLADLAKIDAKASSG